MSRLRALWLVLSVSLVVATFGACGYVMVGSFTISNPEHLAHWRSVARIYGFVVIASLILAVATLICLIRARRIVARAGHHHPGVVAPNEPGLVRRL